MFTGIVAAVGRIERIEPLGDGVRLTVDAGTLGLDDVAIGDSIAIQGACMTAVLIEGNRFSFDVSRESLSKTVGLDRTGEVNLEKALRLSDRLGGHLVSGHVDGLGRPIIALAAGMAVIDKIHTSPCGSTCDVPANIQMRRVTP